LIPNQGEEAQLESAKINFWTYLLMTRGQGS